MSTKYVKIAMLGGLVLSALQDARYVYRGRSTIDSVEYWFDYGHIGPCPCREGVWDSYLFGVEVFATTCMSLFCFSYIRHMALRDQISCYSCIVQIVLFS